MGLCHRPVSSCSLLGLLAHVSRGPGMSWDSRRALHRSPPNEFDCHDPSGRRLLSHVCPFRTNLSSSTFARVVVTLAVFDDSAMTSSPKDNKFFACLCSSIESSTEVSPLVCAHLRRQDSFFWHHRCWWDRRLPRRRTLPSLIKMSVALDRHPRLLDLRNEVD